MTTTKSFQKVNDIFQCRLILADDSEFVIPLREDGYIFATLTPLTYNFKTNRLVLNFPVIIIVILIFINGCVLRVLASNLSFPVSDHTGRV